MRFLSTAPARLVAVALSVRLIDEWWSYLPAGIVEELRRDLGLSYRQAGWLVGLLFLGSLVGSPLEALADHGRRRTSVLAGSLGLAAALGAFAVSSGFTALAVACLTMGPCSGLVVSPVEAALAERDAAGLERLLGVQHALATIGGVVGPVLLGTAAATGVGWRPVFGFSAVTVALFGLLAASAALDDPPPNPLADAPTHGGSSGARRSGWRLVLRRDVLAVAVADLLLGALDEPFLAFAVARAARSGAGADGRQQILAGTVFVGGLVASAAVGRFGIGRRGRKLGAALLLGGTLLAAGCASPLALAAATLAVGAGLGLAWAAVHHRLLTVVPGRAGTVAAVSGVVGAGAGAFPVLAGMVADRFGLGAALVVFFGAAAAFAALSPFAFGPGGGPLRG